MLWLLILSLLMICVSVRHRFHSVNRELGVLAGELDDKGGRSSFGTRYFDDENFIGRCDLVLPALLFD